jgi:hypothetical protein
MCFIIIYVAEAYLFYVIEIETSCLTSHDATDVTHISHRLF